MKDKFFIDTNIWIYAHLENKKDHRHNIALNLLETLPQLVISTQILSEYYSVMLKKKKSRFFDPRKY